MAKKKKDFIQERSLLETYSRANWTPHEESVYEIRKFVEQSMKANVKRQTVLDRAVKRIHQVTEFKEIAIGARDTEGNYRYMAMSGFKEGAEAARRAIVYTPADLKDSSAFPALRIGRVSQYHISEKNPFKPGEESTFNEPQLLGKPRNAPDDMIEGDYIDIYIAGADNEYIAWIELQRTKSGKLPSRETIFWLELFASCLSTVLLNLPVDASA